MLRCDYYDCDDCDELYGYYEICDCDGYYELCDYDGYDCALSAAAKPMHTASLFGPLTPY